MTTHWPFRAAAVVFATLHLSCGDPSAPTAVLSQPSAVTAASGTLRAQNAPPNLIVFTSPSADNSTNPPTISGNPPLTVTFGLCKSDDPDPGDSLNWQYNFGDSGRKPFNADGSFNPDTDHICRVEHTYGEGTYTAWVSVTDKHLEDQSKGVSSLARKSQAFTIKAERPRPDRCPPGISVNTGFEGPAPGTLVEALTIPGVSFDAGGFSYVDPVPPGFPPFSGNHLRGDTLTVPGLAMTFATDQSSYSFTYANLAGNTASVRGFDASGNIVFSRTLPNSSAPPHVTTTGTGTFRKLVFNTSSGIWSFDNLSTTAACQ